MPSRADINGDTAAKTEERNQLAGPDSTKGSLSADTSAGLGTAKHVRVLLLVVEGTWLPEHIQQTYK